jgi:hypothetical protein
MTDPIIKENYPTAKTKRHRDTKEELANQYRHLKAKLTYLGVTSTSESLGLHTKDDFDSWSEAVAAFFTEAGKWVDGVNKLYERTGEVRKRYR